MAILNQKSAWLNRLLNNNHFRINQLSYTISNVQGMQSRNTSTTSSSKGQSISLSGVSDELNHENQKPKLDLTFEDSKTAFKAKNNLELLRGYLVFQLCSMNVLVDNQKTVNLFFKFITQIFCN
jgi:hypothetical protein